LVTNHAYVFDKCLITKLQAFDPYFLYNKPGSPNQFHHVSMNIALELKLSQIFTGACPIQVREGKVGWMWSPGRIPASHPELIPGVVQSSWWQSGSIEHLYQAAKVLQIKQCQKR
jgi:hypothetical protein